MNRIDETVVFHALDEANIREIAKIQLKLAYNSLKTDKHKQITFQLTSAKVNAKTIICSGNLTVAGFTKPIEVEVAYEERNGVLYCKGAQKIKMTDYNVEPPTFMFGSIKTGNEITVSFDVSLTQIKL